MRYTYILNKDDRIVCINNVISYFREISNTKKTLL
jgi:hypothetical protein